MNPIVFAMQLPVTTLMLVVARFGGDLPALEKILRGHRPFLDPRYVIQFGT